MGVFLGPVGDDPQSAEVKRLEIRPGDRLVVKIDREVSPGEFDSIARSLRKTFGPDVPIFLSEPGIDIKVIGPDEAT